MEPLIENPLTFAVNAVHYAKLKQAIDRVLAHEVFTDVEKPDAIPITTGTAESGTQSIFDQTEFETAVKKKASTNVQGTLHGGAHIDHRREDCRFKKRNWRYLRRLTSRILANTHIS